jgi:hypothetical protein
VGLLPIAGVVVVVVVVVVLLIRGRLECNLWSAATGVIEQRCMVPSTRHRFAMIVT